LITGVESTFEEVTVDSLAFKLKNKLGTRWPMIRQPCRRWVSFKSRRVVTILPLRIAAEPHLASAMPSIQSP
jgi:hypothetical protein